MEQVDKDINVRSKDEPTTQTKTQKSNLSFEKADEPQTEDFKACVEGLTLLWIYNYVTDDEFHRIDARLKCKGEPQTENLFTDKDGDVWEWRGDAWYCISGDEPQTERCCTNCKHNGVIEDYECRTCNSMNHHEFIQPQTEQVGVPFGEMDEATFKSHCLNCQRDTADIKCLDCDGNKYFLPYGSKTDCAWK